MKKPRLLIVDDEMDMLRLLSRSIRADFDCEVETVSNAAAALEIFRQRSFDLALLDIRMPGMDGIQLLEQLRVLDPGLTIIMMTAYGAIEVAVESIKKGAYDFITKPFEQNDLVRLLQKGMERSLLLRENQQLQQRIRKEETFQNFVGSSPPMQKLYDTIQMVSRTDVTVLITGESGTGKNLAARAIHALSARASLPYVHVNCPTVPENILESELFGYKKGAFTHATQDKKGLFEEAEGGTICLDEIGDIPLSVQTKLLQVLEDKHIKPLGQTKTVQVNVRLIASTNQDLKARLAAREFREDLYYRLNVVNLHMPPLRERREDIPPLTQHFLGRFAAEFNKPPKAGFSRIHAPPGGTPMGGKCPGTGQPDPARRGIVFRRNDSTGGCRMASCGPGALLSRKPVVFTSLSPGKTSGSGAVYRCLSSSSTGAGGWKRHPRRTEVRTRAPVFTADHEKIWRPAKRS